jgi:hypothetical protein
MPSWRKSSTKIICQVTQEISRKNVLNIILTTCLLLTIPYIFYFQSVNFGGKAEWKYGWAGAWDGLPENKPGLHGLAANSPTDL